jgi:dTDP-4-dehydrorhamnose 3,5-epimerase-like enzyme
MIQNCKIFELPRITDNRGNLTFIEEKKHFPFEIKRLYYLYDVPANLERGGHAHKKLHQLMIAISGKFDVEVDDGENKQTFTLSCPSEGLYISPGIWRDLKNFSLGSVCLVLASDFYSEDDYYRDYNQFLMHNRI